jgi:hypothetical protein
MTQTGKPELDVQTLGFGIANVASIEAIEEVQQGKRWKQNKV